VCVYCCLVDNACYDNATIVVPSHLHVIDCCPTRTFGVTVAFPREGKQAAEGGSRNEAIGVTYRVHGRGR
jgi:hypothetical protein